MKKTILLLILFVAGLRRPAQAQLETANWRFGTQAALRFPAGGSPVPVANSPMISREGCSTVSDAVGNLRCYANPVQVWDRNDAPMPNGTLTSSNPSSSQGVLLLPDPGNSQQIYVFTVDAAENYLVSGLRYSLVNMALRGGLGDVGAVKEVQVPVPGNVLPAEKLTAIRHTNGRDFWIVVHGYGNNIFYAYLLTASGLTTTPVVSSLGAIHSGGGGASHNANCVGYIRASPDGQRLAVAIRDTGLEVFDFSPSTGQVSNFRPVSMNAPYYYGLEFSPNGNKLYISDLTGNSIRQVDLQAPTLVGQLVAVASSYTGAILRGPDNILYVAIDQINYLGTITNPNGTAATCGFVNNGAYMGAGQARQGLPNFPNSYPVAVDFTAPLAVCAGQSVAVSATAGTVPPGTAFAWDFGDPTAGSANAATGASAVHIYANVGSYSITLNATTPTGLVSVRHPATVNAAPVVSLGAAVRTLCAGQSVQLSGAPQLAGSTYRWQDGSISSSYLVHNAGIYWLDVTSPQGCTARDSVEVKMTDCSPVVLPNIITPNGDPLNQAFVLQGLNASDWAISFYNRWGREVYQQASYDNSWAAQNQSAGLYYYLLTNASTGQHYRGWVEVMR